MMINYGMKVRILFKKNSKFKGKTERLRNVTEIHYNYNHRFIKDGALHILIRMVAFESDIHKTGVTYSIEEIEEFETKLETKKAKEF